MELDVAKLTALIIKHVTGQADAQERAMLDEFLADPVNRARVSEIVSREGFMAEKEYWESARGREAGSLVTIMASLQAGEPRRRRVPMRRWWLAAASAMAVGLSVFLFGHYGRVAKVMQTPVQATDLQPGGHRAVLILGSGRELILDSTQEGEIAREPGVTIEKREAGVIDYRNDFDDKPRGEHQEVLYNTLKTPPGGVYEVVLPDHSVAYLNSESSLRYPSVFSLLSARVVELTGEAYFVVQSDPARPFRVFVGGKEVEALGTAFDVNAYWDEPIIKATLLRGSVRASDSLGSVLLQPGQQVQMRKGGGMQVLDKDKVDTDCVVGWKTGDFIFNATPLSEVMRQLGRWYNVKMKYDSSMELAGGGFTAAISRDRPAAEVFKALALSYHFPFAGADSIEVRAMQKE
jgi:transmembrane sensor